MIRHPTRGASSRIEPFRVQPFLATLQAVDPEKPANCALDCNRKARSKTIQTAMSDWPRIQALPLKTARVHQQSARNLRELVPEPYCMARTQSGILEFALPIYVWPEDTPSIDTRMPKEADCVSPSIRPERKKRIEYRGQGFARDAPGPYLESSSLTNRHPRRDHSAFESRYEARLSRVAPRGPPLSASRILTQFDI